MAVGEASAGVLAFIDHHEVNGWSARGDMHWFDMRVMTRGK